MTNSEPQVALVTGASTGIGRAVALRLAAEGYLTYGSVRSEASGDDLLAAAGDTDLRLVVLDVDDTESVEAGIGKVLAEVGRLDVLVNNAGISGGGSVEDTPLDTYERLLNTNALGTLRCCKAAVGAMREAGQGTILNVTSLAARIPQPGMSAYNMSKFAQGALTECLAQELAPFGIRVVAVEPGVVLTPIFEKGFASVTPPTDPYKTLAHRVATNFMESLESPASPEHVADVVWHAITGDYRLHHPATPDAHAALAAKAAVSDESWIESMTQEDDDAWIAWMRQARGRT